MNIVIEAPIGLDEISSLLPEAQAKFDQLSGIFEADEIKTLIENMAAVNPTMSIAIGSICENMPLNEFMVKHVNAKGELTKTKDLKTRQRQAFQTTGLSKSARRQIARKAAKTKRANPTIGIKAQKKAKKAKAKRKMYGLD